MARVAVLIDRPPGCPAWKGWAAWALINALAESQHDVYVFTPLDAADIPPTHARVGVARPAASFGVTTLPSWARALLGYRPDVVHTFAPRASAGPSALTCWPFLEALGAVMPRTRRIATIFDDADLASPAATWLNGHARVTTFDQTLALNPTLRGRVDLMDARGLMPPSGAADPDEIDDGEYLVPAPVDEWRDLRSTLAALGNFLREDPARRVRIVGGWGELPLDRRRETWRALADFTARIRMGPPRTLPEFARDAAHAPGVWPEPLVPGSWRTRVTEALRPNAPGDGLDVVNHLSRIYSAPGRW